MFDRLLPILEDAVLSEWTALPVFLGFEQRRREAQDGREYWASYPFFQLCYIRQGVLEVESEGKVLHVQAGEVLLIPPRIGLHVCSESETDMILIQWEFLTRKTGNGLRKRLEKEEVKDWNMRSKLFRNSLQIIIGAYAKRIGDRMQSLQDECIQNDSATPVVCTLQLFQILVEFVRMARERSLIEDYLKQGNLQEVVRYSLNYIHANYHRELTIAEVASTLYVAPSYFSRLFREVTGINPLNYLNQTRVAQACNLLEQEDQISVGSIATLVGFTSTQRFNVSFRKLMGMTPKQYRKKYLEERKLLESELDSEWDWANCVPNLEEWETERKGAMLLGEPRASEF